MLEPLADLLYGEPRRLPDQRYRRPRFTVLSAYCQGRYSLRAQAREELPFTQLTELEWIILDRLDITPTAGLAEFRGVLGIPASTLTGVVDRLVRRELVRRFRPAHDRRLVAIELTDKGRTVARTVTEGLREVDRSLLAFVHESELAAVFAVSGTAANLPDEGP